VDPRDKNKGDWKSSVFLLMASTGKPKVLHPDLDKNGDDDDTNTTTTIITLRDV
jgi:hypothetical protein